MRNKIPKGKNVCVSPSAYEAIQKAAKEAVPQRNLREQINVMTKQPINA